MINILIVDNNLAFRHGMENFLRVYFKERLHRDIGFNYAVTDDTLRNADIIIRPLRCGEQYLCAPLFCLQTTGIIICIADDNNSQHTGFAECYRTAIWISRREAINEIEKKIALAWTVFSRRKSASVNDKCHKCKSKTITEKQALFLHAMKKGHSLKEIQRLTHLEYKALFSLKQYIKTKFSLKTDADLLQFCELLEHEKDQI